MESEATLPSSSGPGHSSNEHEGSPHRRRYRRKSRRKKSLKYKAKRSILRFYEKKKSLIIGAIALVLLLITLLFIFSQVEHEAINQFSRPDPYE